MPKNIIRKENKSSELERVKGGFMGNDKVYVVTSYVDTLPGKVIKVRAEMKFWNRYLGDNYSHVSLSRDNTLNNMMSFARREINNPFNAGLVKEDIHSGMFALKKDKSKIAVMQVDVTPKQYDEIGNIMERYWARRDELGFNFAGLASMLFCARGLPVEDRYFCSEWVTTVLQEAGVDIFSDKKPYNIRPFDFYCLLKDSIVYEGRAQDYPVKSKVLYK